MKNDLLDDDLFEKHKSTDKKFKITEADNFLIARNWKKVIKDLNGEINGDCNEVLLDCMAKINANSQHETTFKILKQLQSGAGSIMPRIAHTYKEIKIEKSLDFIPKDIMIRPKSFLKDIFIKKNNSIPHGSYLIHSNDSSKTLHDILRLSVVKSWIERKELLLIKSTPNKKSLTIIVKFIPVENQQIRLFIKTVNDITEKLM